MIFSEYTYNVTFCHLWNNASINCISNVPCYIFYFKYMIMCGLRVNVNDYLGQQCMAHASATYKRK